jgi:tetratricopeptide (TPR) repeat protein
MGVWVTGRRFAVAATRAAVRAAIVLVAGLTLLTGANPGRAAEVEMTADDGHGRIVISFPDKNVLPKHRATATNGVLVVTFDEPVEMDVARAATVLAGYVTIARADPDGSGARFALARGVTVNTMEAGSKLFVDLLPMGWAGPPPPLPSSVISELAQRAEEAAKQARHQEMLRIAGVNAARVEIRTARGPTFSRFVFKWNVPFEASFERRNSGVLVTFDQPAEPDLAPIRADLPPFVEDVTATRTEEGGLAIFLGVPESADVRAFREDGAYVVDVQGDGPVDAGNPAASAVHAAAAGGDEGTHEVRSLGTRETPASGLDSAPAHPPEQPDSPSPIPHNLVAGVANERSSEPVETGNLVTEDHPGTLDHAADAKSGASDPDPEPADPGPELPDEAIGAVLDDGVIRVEAKRIGAATRIVFPFEHEIGSALFSRGGALWIVFDDPSPIELVPLQDALSGLARSVTVQPAGESQTVRIDMAEPLLATLNPDNTYWIVTIGDMVIEPTRPLAVKRVVEESGNVHVEVPFGPVSHTHEIRDPVIGDTLLVVTGTGQPRGLIKPQSFAEIDALSSAHGLAFVPKVDDVELKVSDQVVTLRRPSGLALTTAGGPKRESLLDLPGAGASDAPRAGAVDYTGSLAVPPPEFWRKRHELSTRIAESQDPDEQVEAWYEAAKFYVSNSLGAEALAALDLIARRDGSEAVSDRMAVMRAGAQVMMGRPDEAYRLLDGSALAESADAAVWRAIALADMGDYAAAHRAWVRGEGVVDGFPEAVRRRFFLAGVRTAIELNDYGRARTLVARIDTDQLSRHELDALAVLHARALDANGHPVEAIDALSGVVRSGRGAPAAEATLRLVRLQRREGLITLDQAIDRLEQLAVAWRGDDTELETLRVLGQYAVEAKNYRRAFEVMRLAMEIAPDADVTRLMNEEMQAAFASLFLGGGANGMTPVQALALYYDFRELTPPGRRGDAMVRHLADRLVDVDLLPQAAELLSYQVENRLRGAARAEVAADLAMIYLMDRRPDRALATIARTRQPQLPVTIERQRRVVEAKALADTGNPELAIDILKPLKGTETERLRADILWRAGRNQEAAEQFERLLGRRWADELPLTDAEQFDVLRAGVGYTLAEDQLGVDRLRSKFGRKMAETGNMVAFDTVTGPVSTAGQDFDALVKSMASIDGAEAFLADYRTRFRPGGGQEGTLPVPAGDGAADPVPAAEAAPAEPPAVAG